MDESQRDGEQIEVEGQKVFSFEEIFAKVSEELQLAYDSAEAAPRTQDEVVRDLSERTWSELLANAEVLLNDPEAVNLAIQNVLSSEGSFVHDARQSPDVLLDVAIVCRLAQKHNEVGRININIDTSKQQQEVAEITNTVFFRNLQTWKGEVGQSRAEDETISTEEFVDELGQAISDLERAILDSLEDHFSPSGGQRMSQAEFGNFSVLVRAAEKQKTYIEESLASRNQAGTAALEIKIDQGKRDEQVNEIVQSDEFQDLLKRARELRQRK